MTRGSSPAGFQACGGLRAAVMLVGTPLSAPVPYDCSPVLVNWFLVSLFKIRTRGQFARPDRLSGHPPGAFSAGFSRVE
jgi:hypothetical protein